MKDFLFEIGVEEIPAGYIEPALNAFCADLCARLDQARIGHGQAAVFGTPRRLAVLIRDMAPSQKTVMTEQMGPPEKVALDEDGNFTMAARKFAEKAGVAADALKIVETPKGRYVCARKKEKGAPTSQVLKSLLPQVINAIPFPKSMRWADLDVSFARPIQSLTAVLGKSAIRFEFGNLTSGRHVFGHRFLSPGKIAIQTPADYAACLAESQVIVDIAARKAMIREAVAKAAGQKGGRVLPDEDLVGVVANLVEYPVCVVGQFDAKYLELPREVLITAMREHQKYFAVEDADHRLLPVFIAVNNTLAHDMNLVTKGHERVLRARLEDARFFYRTDAKADLKDWNEELRRVLFQAKLGSMHDKVRRIGSLTVFIADELSLDRETKDMAREAAELCKVDLVSQMVGEFANLQGVMGRVYAGLAGKPAQVAQAIEEHYRPTYAGGPLPQSIVGAVVAIADKIDSICGCFSVGLGPTGASDPYALRRQAIGLMQILLDQNLPLSLRGIIRRGLSNFKASPELADEIFSFFCGRMTHMLTEEGFSRDVVAAVLAADVDRLPDIRQRVQALQRLKNAPDFEPLAVAFKRVVNIIRKSGDAQTAEGIGQVQSERFEAPCEGELWDAFAAVREKALALLARGEFETALLEVAGLRPFVDAFFDGVMVMAEDPALRQNRLAVLQQISALFDRFADFSKLSS